MTQTLTKLTLSAALLVAGAVAASAADISGGAPGGIKDYRGAAVPVPAPAPYEETYKYYMSGHLGWTFASNGTMKLQADHGGINGPSMPTYNDLQGPHVVSLAIGRYITPSLRAELGFDYRAPQRPLKASAIQYYTGRVTGNVMVNNPAIPGTQIASSQTNTYDVARNEEISVSNHTFMLNAYYDINRGGSFTPYIGAGLGFVKRDVSRATTESAACRTGSNSVDTTSTACQYNNTAFPPGTLVPSFFDTYAEERSGVGLAAALMAGATYHITSRTHWDLGYRLTYMGGKVAVVAPSLGGVSSLDVGARVDHEIRTGLRFDLW